MTEDDRFKYISSCFLAMLAVATIILNSFCLDVIRRSRSLLRKPSTMFIINLLVVQLLQGLIVLPLHVARNARITTVARYEIMICNGFRFSYLIAFFGTCLGVLLTSFDRFCAVYWITTYRIRLTKRRISVALFLKWVYTLLLCVMPFFNREEDAVHAVASRCRDSYTCDYNPSRVWTILMLLGNTALPYVIIIVIYVYVVRTVKFFETRARQRNSKCFDVTLQDQSIITIKRKDIYKHKKITKLAIVLCISYAVLWLPSIVYYALQHACPTCFHVKFTESCWSDYTDFLVKYLAFLNGIIVPVVYCFYQKDFRRLANLNSVRSSISDLEKIKLINDQVV